MMRNLERDRKKVLALSLVVCVAFVYAAIRIVS